MVGFRLLANCDHLPEMKWKEYKSISYSFKIHFEIEKTSKLNRNNNDDDEKNPKRTKNNYRQNCLVVQFVQLLASRFSAIQGKSEKLS